MNEEELAELLNDERLRIAYGGIMQSTIIWMESFATVEQRVNFARAVIFSLQKSIDNIGKH